MEVKISIHFLFIFAVYFDHEFAMLIYSEIFLAKMHSLLNISIYPLFLRGFYLAYYLHAHTVTVYIIK